MAYAERTTVPVEQTRMEIERAVNRYGATSYASFVQIGSATIMFEAKERRIRFDLPLPRDNDTRSEKLRRQRWRALLLCIKAKLESVESKIESFEEAFLAHVVMPDGMTVHQHAQENIKLAYSGGEMRPLLAPPKGPPA